MIISWVGLVPALAFGQFARGEKYSGTGGIPEEQTAVINSQVFGRKDARYLAGSLGKPFIAMAVLKMAEAQKFKLTDPIKKYLPDLNLHNPWESENPVTIWHLLEHSSGLADMRFGETFIKDSMEAVCMLRESVGKQYYEVSNPPGRCHTYSNLNYSLLGWLLEEVSGKPYEKVVYGTIMAPIGMGASHFVQAHEGRNTQPHIKGKLIYPDPPVYFHRPALELELSGKDLGIFMNWFRSGVTIYGDSLLSAASWEKMLNVHTTLAAKAGYNNGFTAGFETGVEQGHRFIGINGLVKGYRCNFRYFPERYLCVGLLTNDQANTWPAFLESTLKNALPFSQPDNEKKEEIVPGTFPPTGYYHPINPRNRFFRFVQYPDGGIKVGKDMPAILIKSNRSSSYTKWIPATGNVFQQWNHPEITGVWGTLEDGTPWIQMGTKFYVQQSSFGPWLFRKFFIGWFALSILAIGIGIIQPLAALGGQTKVNKKIYTYIFPALVFGITLVAFMPTDYFTAGQLNLKSVLIFFFSILFPVLTGIAIYKWFQSEMKMYAKIYWGILLLGNVIVTGYMWHFDLIGVRLWA